MSDSIPLSELGSPGDDGLRRDRWGRLLVVPPGADEPEGYTRVTTIAKTNDDGGGLMPWKATLACVGTMLRPGLRARWEALIAAHDGDPWYAGAKAKDACKRLVEECAKAGGSSNRAEIGTALHAITALLDVGEVPKHLTPETERDVEVYVNTLVAAGISIATLYGNPAVEVTCVLDDYAVGGSFDRLVNVHGYGLPMIADLKTGSEIKYSWQSFCVQLAAYSRANAIYEQGADPNGSEDVRAPMPDIDQHHGLIIWLPAGEARCELHVVDLDAGWEAFELSMAVRAWRARRDIHGVLAPVGQGAGVRTPQAPQRALEAPQGDETPEAEPAEPMVWAAWLQLRIDNIGRYSDIARQDLMRSWPAGVAPLKAGTYTIEQLAIVEAICDDVEGRNGVPFGPQRPTPPSSRRTEAQWLERLGAEFPGSTVTTNNTRTTP